MQADSMLDEHVISDSSTIINDDLDPDVNLFEDLLQCNCNYYDEDSFNELVSSGINEFNSFSFLHLNIRSIPRNFHSFENFVQCLKHRFSILGISETWHNPNTCDLFPLEGYQCVHSYRYNRKGGGVTMYIKDNIQFNLRQDLEIRNCDVDNVFIEFNGKHFGFSHNVVVGTIYRPPNTNLQQFNDNLNELLDSLKSERKICYILGDFNINLMNCESHCDTNIFFNSLISHSFYPVISKPTRITEYSATLIDNIFCNQLAFSGNIKSGILCTDISDHFPVFSIFNKSVDNPIIEEHVFHRPVTQKGKQKFVNKIRSLEWQSVFSEHDAQQAFSKIQSMIQSAYEESFPLIKFKKRPATCKNWLTDCLKKSIRNKNKLYMWYRKRPTVYNKNKYLMYKRALRKLLNAAEKNYYDLQFERFGNDLKNSWKILKRLIGVQPKLTNNEFSIDGKRETDYDKIANAFNAYFVNIGQSLDCQLPQVSEDEHRIYMKSSNSSSIYLAPATATEVTSILTQMKNSAPGWEGFKAEV